jgi:DNA-binding FadR family transcriptional regulator
LGILEAYWEAYEEVGLNLYSDYANLQLVWEYHQKMVDAICRGDYEAGYSALLEHTQLLQYRPLMPVSAENESLKAS